MDFARAVELETDNSDIYNHRYVLCCAAAANILPYVSYILIWMIDRLRFLLSSYKTCYMHGGQGCILKECSDVSTTLMFLLLC